MMILLHFGKNGLKMEPEYLYSSQPPTAREFVNMIGAGHNHLYIGEPSKYRDEWGLKAREQLENDKIMTIATLP